ncbi:Armadillo repeat-containing protein 4 [Lobulomyces angularis]|nr:Armadillo repeat-containing protein 4 [Lobulomyces angularis]
MGNSLATRIESTNSTLDLNATAENVAESNNESNQKTIHTSLINFDILYDFIKILEKFCIEHHVEAKTEFKRPLEWSSPFLRPNLFNSGSVSSGTANNGNSTSNTQSNWIVSNQKGTNKSVVSSTALKSDGKPFFQLIQQSIPSTKNANNSSSIFLARVDNFDQLNKVLKLADEHKLSELQALIQVNRDGISTILGLPSGTFSNNEVDPLVIAFEALNKDTNPKKIEQNQKLYKLSLILNSYDLQLMKTAVNVLEREKFIDVQKVSEELEMLKAFCGKDQKCALQSIDWESDYTFSNGCKAPPWRQVFGEICYVEVRPMDKDHIVITATKNGFFINKGYLLDEKGNERLNYEALDESPVKPTLTDLLKSYSPHFFNTIDKQEYLYHPDENLISNIGGAVAAEGSTAHDVLLHDGNLTEDEHEQGEETGTKKNERRQTLIVKKK